MWRSRARNWLRRRRSRTPSRCFQPLPGCRIDRRRNRYRYPRSPRSNPRQRPWCSPSCSCRAIHRSRRQCRCCLRHPRCRSRRRPGHDNRRKHLPVRRDPRRSGSHWSPRDSCRCRHTGRRHRCRWRDRWDTGRRHRLGRRSPGWTDPSSRSADSCRSDREHHPRRCPDRRRRRPFRWRLCQSDRD